MSDKIEIGAILKLDSAQSLAEVGKIKQAFKEAQKALLSAQEEFGEFSKEAVRAAKFVAELKEKIQDSKALTEAFNPEKKFAAFAQAAQGAVGGVEAVSGTMALLGVESGEVEKALLKVQAAMAISRGIDDINEFVKGFHNLKAVIMESTVFQKANEAATKAASFTMKLFGGSVETTAGSFKFLKGAIVATGIGLLVVAVGELVSWFNELSSAAEKAAEEEKKALETKEKYASADLKGQSDFIARQEALDVARAKARGASEKEIFEIQQGWQKQRVRAQSEYLGQLDENDEKYMDAKKGLDDAESKLTVDSLNFQAEQHKKELEEQKSHNQKLAAAAKQKADAEKRAHEEAVKEAQKLNHDLAEANGESLSHSDRDKEMRKLQGEYDDKLKVLRKAGADETELTLWFRLQQSQINNKYDKEDADKRVKALDERLAAEKDAAEKRKEIHQNMVSAMAQASADLVKMEGLSSEDKIQVLNEADQKILTDTSFTEDERTKLLAANSEARKQIEQIERDHKLEMMNQIAGIADAMSDIAGRQTAAGKAFALASTLISTYTSAQKAYESQFMPIPDPSSPIRGAFAAAAAVISGIAKVKAIYAVQTPGGTGSPSINTSALSTNAPLSPGTPGNAVTTLDKQSIDQMGNQVIKTYVTETDIQNNRERIEKINRLARIGG